MDCFQGHQHGVATSYDDNYGSYNDTGHNHNYTSSTRDFYNCGYGNPRVGKETRPLNFTYKIYKRVS